MHTFVLDVRVVEGKTPEIIVQQARTLLASISTTNVVGLRDRAIIAILIYTAARAGAVAALRRGNLYHAGEQWMLHFEEKGGKSREIPVRHDLEQILFAYIDSAGLQNTPKDAPLFSNGYPQDQTAHRAPHDRLPGRQDDEAARRPAARADHPQHRRPDFRLI